MGKVVPFVLRRTGMYATGEVLSGDLCHIRGDLLDRKQETLRKNVTADENENIAYEKADQQDIEKAVQTFLSFHILTRGNNDDP
jgi:hypothetical protein